MKFGFLPFVVVIIVAMVFLRRICSSRPGDGEQRRQSLAALTAHGRGLYCFQPQPQQPVLHAGRTLCVQTDWAAWCSLPGLPTVRFSLAGSSLLPGRRARRTRFPTCGVIRVAGYSVVWDYDPTPIFSLKSTKRSAAAILGRSAPSLLFMVRFRIFCCRQISLLCLLGYHPILLLSISHLSIFLRNRLNRP